MNKVRLGNNAYITNTFDDWGRMLSTTLKNSGGTALDGASYSYNELNQRSGYSRWPENSGVSYGYDAFEQLISATGAETGGTNRWQEQFTYAYDLAGNLTNRIENKLTNVFAVNNLNQLSTGTRSGKLTVTGTSSSAATNVTVNSSNAIRYADNTFVLTNVTLVNGTNTFTAIAKDNLGRVDTNVVTAYLPTNVVFQYDANGNLVFDGLRFFEYDDENQLIRVTVTNSFKTEFAYDGKMRRRIRREYLWQGGTFRLMQEVRYVYDGNLVVQERDALNVPTVSYTRGKDLSGSLEGAGGIGGLLAMSQLSSVTPQHFYYHADGNGNITALINSLQNVVAKYLYAPFGDILSMSGPLADVNLYRFSSKEFHPASGLLAYLYRYYTPDLQRWPGPDLLGEAGFGVLRGHSRYLDRLGMVRGVEIPYVFVLNAPTLLVDPLGLSAASDCYDQCAAETADRMQKCKRAACTGAAVGASIGAPVVGWIGAKGGPSGLIGGFIIGAGSGAISGGAVGGGGCVALAAFKDSQCNYSCLFAFGL